MTTNFESVYVVDTHPLVWYLQGSKKLSQIAKDIIDAGILGNTRLVTSAIVVAELYYVHQKGLLTNSFKDVFIELDTFIEFVPFEASDTLKFNRDARVTEMHDRIIVGIANDLSAPIVTKDQIIVESRIVKTIW